MKNGRSEKHDILTEKALRWISGRFTFRGGRGGFEYRVPNLEGYTADAAAIGSLQERYIKRYLPEFNANLNEGIFGIYSERYFSMIFESKATRSDFLSTFGSGERHSNRLIPAANLHWVVTSKGVCVPKEVPHFWGLLIESGTGLREEKKPIYQKMKRKEMDRFAHAILWLKPRRTWFHHGGVDSRLRVPDLSES